MELNAITGISPRLAERYGQAIVAAVARGLAVKEGRRPRYPQSPRIKRTAAQESRLKRLKSWREGKAAQLGIATGLLANNTLLERLAETDMKKAQGDATPGLKEWQKRLFADEIALLL